MVDSLLSALLWPGRMDLEWPGDNDRRRSWRNDCVFELDFCLSALTLSGLIFGIWGILWTRLSRGDVRVLWGRGLFVLSLLALGGSSLVAAMNRSEALVPLGLSAGMLLVGMLWEGPRAVWQQPDTGSRW